MQKEINNKGLYTSVFEYDKRLYVNQLQVRENKLEVILFTWSKLAKHKLIRSLPEKKELTKEINYYEEELSSILHSKNAWWSFFLLSKGLGSLVVVKTDNRVLGTSASRQHDILAQYSYYKTGYERLKNILIKPPEITKERKKYERGMESWRKKLLKGYEHPGPGKGLYTIVLEYNGDVFVLQFYIDSGEDINNILKVWPEELKKHKAFLNETNYAIITQRASEEAYRLVPIQGLVNVWGTYFMLSKGLGNIYVIKTDEEVLVTE